MNRAKKSYTVELKKSHLEWGSYRKTGSRDIIYGEGYIPIPSKVAINYGLYNGNETGKMDILGKNTFNFKTKDKFIEGILKSQGASKKGYKYAKQFSVSNDLKSLGKWFKHINAKPGDKIRVSWENNTDIIIEKL